MRDDERLRARIEAQVASRRVDAPRAKRDRLGRQTRGPDRPWLARKPASADPPGDRDIAAEVPSVVDLPLPLPPPTVPTGDTPPPPLRPWKRRPRPDIEPAAEVSLIKAAPEPEQKADEKSEPVPVPAAPDEEPAPEPVEPTAAAPAAAEPDEAPPAADKRHRVTLRGVTRLLIVVVIAAVIATLLRTYVVAPYYIPSASMESTLHGCTGCNNDHVLVNKLSYRRHDVRRGDVVVFNRPKAWQVSENVLIKRVIGLPGDTLSAKNGIVYVDGLALNEPYVDKACQSGTTNFPANPIKVQDGQAFVMGDNRCDSSDSRRFGAIPQSAVIGRAFLIIWPLGRLHGL